ncbi:expansin-like A1 [Chenopodium quinoa]|uniref:expansin-like A1 n=1 Tax=Chenopodium quinoa TaxID=63459 RepID=UPI000B77A75B|nr:expansin-like A1 [Chenopodium quinoa]
MAFIVLSFLFMILVSSASACGRCVHKSNATYTSLISSGSCGYDPLALGFNGGLLAGALPSLFKQGAGCGACFEISSKPYYLAFTVLYQGGQTEIIGMDVAKVGSNNWASMKRNYGAVWDTNKVPTGPLKLRFLIKSGYVLTQKVLPPVWRSGSIYDSGIQINDIAHEKCYNCDQTTW